MSADPRVALVTGASRGIGRSIAVELARSGHAVAVNYLRRADAADEVVAQITAGGGRAAAVGGDVSEEDDVASIFEETEAELGPPLVLVNNAGITRDELLVRMKPEIWDEVINVNLRSAYLCTRAAMRGMLKAKFGRIVSISSVAGIAGNPGQANYSAAKAGLIGFTKSIAKEVGSRGITANVVAPGFIETDLTAHLGEKVINEVRSSIPIGRFGQPHEVASLVGYLASDAAAYLTGQVVGVDGGVVLGL